MIHVTDIALYWTRPGAAALAHGAANLSRGTAAYRQSRPGFAEELSKASPVGARAEVPRSTANYTVRRGDTLSHIVRDRLSADRGETPSAYEVHKAVLHVARSNGIPDPDLILPGQTLDLGVLAGQGGAAASPPQGKNSAGALRTIFEEPEIKARPNGGEIRFTVDGPARLSSSFGMRRDPFSGEQRFHDGVDIAAKTGTAIRPFRAGVVSFAGWKSGYGQAVVVKHADGLESIYAHNASNAVKVGDTVEADTVLGRVGSTGRSTGPHLHFEIRRHGRAVDPLPYLKAEEPVRLAHNHEH